MACTLRPGAHPRQLVGSDLGLCPAAPQRARRGALPPPPRLDGAAPAAGQGAAVQGAQGRGVPAPPPPRSRGQAGTGEQRWVAACWGCSAVLGGGRGSGGSPCKCSVPSLEFLSALGDGGVQRRLGTACGYSSGKNRTVYTTSCTAPPRTLEPVQPLLRA